MTKKLVTNAMKSPSLVGELKKYHRQQLELNAKRGVIVILSFLFLLLQYIGFISPITHSNNSYIFSDTIYGGVSSKQDLLLEYDSKNSAFKKAANSLSVSRNDIKNSKETTTANWLNDSSLTVAWSKIPIYKTSSEPFDKSPNSTFLAYDKSSGFTYFGHVIKAASLRAANYPIILGKSGSGSEFAVLKNSGNFITNNSNADVCYKDPNITFSYSFCPSSNSFKAAITVKNLTYKTDSTFIKNRPGDRIQYTLHAKNLGEKPKTFVPQMYIGDVLEYAELYSVDSARFEEIAGMLQWPEVTILPEQEKTFTFSVKLLAKTPLNATASTNTASYDCYASSYFGGIASIKISCPTPKVIERIANIKPELSLILLTLLILLTNIVIYIKSYIFSKEREIILKHTGEKA